MNEQNDQQKQEAGGCGPGCCCGTSASGGRGRWVVGIIILIVAGVLVAKAMIKDNVTPTAPVPEGFAALPASVQNPEAAPVASPAVAEVVREIAGLAELNTVAADTAGVFVFLPAKGGMATNAPKVQMLGAVRMIEPQLRGGKISLFTLKEGSVDYEQLASQMAVPGVLAMVKGAGMSAASGDITEAKLVQAFVGASRTGGCGPASAGCGPAAGGCK